MTGAIALEVHLVLSRDGPAPHPRAARDPALIEHERVADHLSLALLHGRGMSLKSVAGAVRADEHCLEPVARPFMAPRCAPRYVVEHHAHPSVIPTFRLTLACR